VSGGGAGHRNGGAYRLGGILAPTLAGLLAACGPGVVHHAAGTPSTIKRWRAAVPRGTVTVAVQVPSARYQILRPTAVVSPPATSGAETFRAPLGLGSGGDRVTVVRARASGDGTLVVRDSRGRVVARLRHVGWAGALLFFRHTAVLVTRVPATWCGTGGCAYGSYAVDPKTRVLQAVPVMPWATPWYQWDDRTSRWIMEPDRDSVGFFGWVSLGPKGLSYTYRLYNLLASRATLSYAYATAPGFPAGEWVQIGRAQFTPTAPYPGYGQGWPAATVVPTYLEAVVQDQPALATPLAVSRKAAATLWRTLRAIRHWGLSAAVDWANMTEDGSTANVPVEATAGSGVDARLSAWQVVVTTVSTAAGPRVGAVRLSALPLRVATVPAVLASLAANPVTDRWLVRHPGRPLTITEEGLRWTVAVAGAAFGVTIDAGTGRLAGSL
jgi:hypothetical protein